MKILLIQKTKGSYKGQLILKADWRAIDSPKKRTDEFDLVAVKSKKANKTNSSVHFLKNLWRSNSAFEINLPLVWTTYFTAIAGTF